VNVLIDTHVLVWWFLGDQRIPAAVRTLIDADETTVFVSAASAWEVTTKFRVGKMPEAAKLVGQFFSFMAQCDFQALPVTVEHGHRAGLLPGPHKDPFDRMLAAQEIIENLDLVTADPAMAGLGARVVR
jgi:PIN domain nuclease of toxin-antitoxin system